MLKNFCKNIFLSKNVFSLHKKMNLIGQKRQKKCSNFDKVVSKPPNAKCWQTFAKIFSPPRMYFLAIKFLIFFHSFCFVPPSVIVSHVITGPRQGSRNPLFSFHSAQRHNSCFERLQRYSGWLTLYRSLMQQTNKCNSYHMTERTHIPRRPCNITDAMLEDYGI